MFIDSAVFICDFHRSQAWERWFSKKENGYAGVKDDMICKLRRIAVSMTGEERDKAIDDLNESEYWSGKLHECMETYWLPIKKVYLLVLLNYSQCA